MDLGISGKTAFITGAGRGLGRNIAQCLAREGVRVIANSRSLEDLQDLVRQLPHFSGAEDHVYYQADLATAEGSYQALEFLKSYGIEPDIVIHNVGGNTNRTPCNPRSLSFLKNSAQPCSLSVSAFSHAMTSR